MTEITVSSCEHKVAKPNKWFMCLGNAGEIPVGIYYTTGLFSMQRYNYAQLPKLSVFLHFSN